MVVFFGGESERRCWHCNVKKKVIDGCDHVHAKWCPFVSHVDDDGHDAYMPKMHTYMCFSHEDGIDAYIYIHTFVCIYIHLVMVMMMVMMMMMPMHAT